MGKRTFFNYEWTKKYGVVSQNDKVLCIIDDCMQTLVRDLYVIKRHFQNIHHITESDEVIDRQVKIYFDELNSTINLQVERRVQKSAKRGVNVLEKYARQFQRLKKSGFVTFDVFLVDVQLRADLFYNGFKQYKSQKPVERRVEPSLNMPKNLELPARY
ncbi:hypothetical protein A3Q56_05586 [Intoshia linei]|uniref:Uncharacterized protein n=1 Tax=Intoshia linei TaxID=1819745 RepID=A0A177AXE4_9BILA|nr:hypothetical protein A3Q56_05586 [Intoshia linei]